jgi:hypothetical protein
MHPKKPCGSYDRRRPAPDVSRFWELMAPLRFTDDQLRAVLIAGGPLPPEKQSAFLERVGDHLRLVGYDRVSDTDVERAVHAALRGLLHAPAA